MAFTFLLQEISPVLQYSKAVFYGILQVTDFLSIRYATALF